MRQPIAWSRMEDLSNGAYTAMATETGAPRGEATRNPVPRDPWGIRPLGSVGMTGGGRPRFAFEPECLPEGLLVE